MLLLLAIACADPPVDWFAPLDPTPAGQWLQYRLDPTHRGTVPEGTSVGPELSLLWKSEPYAIGAYSASKGSPTVDEDRVYVGIDDGRLLALDKDDGRLLWAFETRAHEVELQREDDANRGIHGTPAVWGETVFIGDYEGWLYAVDRSSGELLWEEQLGGSIGASPVVYQDHVFMAVEYPDPDGRVFVVDAETGRTRFKTGKLGDHPHSSATIDPSRGLFVVGANNGSFSAWDFVDEQPAWELTFTAPDGSAQIKATAAVDGDTAWITSWDDALHAVDLDSGAEQYAFETSGNSMSSPSLLDGVVTFGSHDGRLYAVHAETGDWLWEHQTDAMIISSPTVVEETGVVLFGSNDGWLRMLDLVSGELLWSQELDGWVSSVPVATGDRLYVSDASGTVWCFEG